MMKANLKKMILAAAMAAFMVYVPAAAEDIEEDMIIEESFGEAEAVAAETAADVPAVVIEIVGLEEISEAEVPEQVAQAAEAAQTEANAGAQAVEEPEAQPAKTFTYENDEVIIKAEAVVELPENIEMQVRKLEEGSAEYEAAKQTVAGSCGTADDAEYEFYDVTFTADGEEVELAAGSIYVQMAFKTMQVSSENETQKVLHIDETGVSDVTAQTEDGSSLCSVSFAM